MEISIRGFPMPPSSNNAYINSESGGRVKARSTREYQDTVKWWAIQNAHQMNRLRDWVLMLPPKHAIRLDRMFNFMPHKILTKNGEPKRNDTTNRIKLLDDAVSALIGIDDCYFWNGYVDKSPIIVEGLQECVDLHFGFIDLSKVRSFADADQ